MEAAILGRAGEWRATLVYGFAHLGKSLFWYSSELLFAYFLTEMVGLSADRMGVVLAAAFLVSAAIDIAVGAGFSTRLTTARAAGQLQLIGALLCSLALAGVFLGAWVVPEWRFAYAIVAGILFRIAFALYDVPQNALMALATGDARSRARTASTRIWFSGAATLLVATMIGPLVARQGDGSAILLLLGMTLGFAIVAIGSAAMLHRQLHALVPGTRAMPAAAAAKRWPASFWLLLGVIVVTSVFTPAFAKLEPYFAAYALASASWGAFVIIAMALGIVAGQPLWPRLCARLGAGAVMTLSALVQLAGLLLFWWSGAASPALSAVAAFGFGIGNGGVGMVQWAAFSETVARMGPPRTGLSYGLFSATAKLALAAGGLLLANALSGIDFRGADRMALVTLMAAIPAVGALCCVLAGIALHRAMRMNR